MNKPAMPLGGSLWFYPYSHGRGRELLAKTLGSAEPFSLPGSAIDERVLAAGFTADVDHVQREPFPTADAVSMVRVEGKMFVVSIDLERETIAVQEQRAEPYETRE